MLRSNRDVLAVLYSALIFATIVSPYAYIACGALSYFTSMVALIVIPWLVACTAVLLLIWVGKTNVEDKLSGKLGRYWPPIIAVVVCAALFSTYFIVAKLANFTLLEPVEYWYYLILISGALTAVAAVVIIVTKPSRLEKAFASVFSRSKRFSAIWRFVGFVALLVVFIVAGAKLYEYYLYKRPSLY